ncbi:MAG: pantoate--beta-alanine ligase [Verrucomicrobiales bacterium]|nr:pantoate--beta-alanine ligase [Verrucomicrobiales bacterium]
MEVLSTKTELSDWLEFRKGAPRTLVPTMGALHRGHTSLFDLAGEQGGDVVATIFVNPTQFGPNEDFDDYPRQLEADLARCETHGVSAVFTPPPAEMYEPEPSISIHESKLSTRLCGTSRPGHFDGVCTVVAKLFNLTRPDAAVFGEKDFQQLAVLRRLTRDLNFPIRIIPGPTVRESDGLAMSSRNAFLNEEERGQAPVIQRALSRVAGTIAGGEIVSPDDALQSISEEIESESLSKIDYVKIVDSETLEPLSSFDRAEPRLLAAVFFGKTRLIDNVGLPALNG